jgi:hypothetical protein
MTWLHFVFAQSVFACVGLTLAMGATPGTAQLSVYECGNWNGSSIVTYTLASLLPLTNYLIEFRFNITDDGSKANAVDMYLQGVLVKSAPYAMGNFDLSPVGVLQLGYDVVYAKVSAAVKADPDWDWGVAGVAVSASSPAGTWGGEVRTYKPFYLSSETVLPFK